MAWKLTRGYKKQANGKWAETVFLSDNREITYNIVILLPICAEEADGDGGEKIKKYFFKSDWRELKIKAKRKSEAERRVLLTKNFGRDARELVSNIIFMKSFRETIEFFTNKNMAHDIPITTEIFFDFVDIKNTINATMETSPKQDLENYELANFLEYRNFIVSSNQL